MRILVVSRQYLEEVYKHVYQVNRAYLISFKACPLEGFTVRFKSQDHTFPRFALASQDSLAKYHFLRNREDDARGTNATRCALCSVASRRNHHTVHVSLRNGEFEEQN